MQWLILTLHVLRVWVGSQNSLCVSCRFERATHGVMEMEMEMEREEKERERHTHTTPPSLFYFALSLLPPLSLFSLSSLSFSLLWGDWVSTKAVAGHSRMSHGTTLCHSTKQKALEGKPRTH